MNSFSVFLGLLDIADERFVILLVVANRASDKPPAPIATTWAARLQWRSELRG
jgi:hypothetical protein